MMTYLSLPFCGLAFISLAIFACSGGEESSQKDPGSASGGASSLEGDSGTGGGVATASGGGRNTSTPLDESDVDELCDLYLQEFGNDRATCEHIVVLLSSSLGEGTLDEMRAQCADRVDQCLLNAEEVEAGVLSDCQEQWFADPACSATAEEVTACYDAQLLQQEAHRAKVGTCATADFMIPEDELSLGIADECFVVALKCPGFWGP